MTENDEANADERAHQHAANADVIERITKLGTLLALVLYILGLLTVNNYLRYVGVSDFSLIKPRYVYLGGWLGLGCLVGLLVWYAFFSRVLVYAKGRSAEHDSQQLLGEAGGGGLAARAQGDAAQANRPRRPRFIRVCLNCGTWICRVSLWLVVPIVLIGLGFAAVVVVLSIFGSFTRAVSFEDAATVTTLCLAIGGALYAVWALLRDVRHIREAPFLGLICAMVVLAFGVGAYLRFFAVVLYPIIPEQFGGGSSEEIQLLLGDGGMTAQFTALTLPFSGDEALTLPVHVLFENDDSYVLSVPDGRAVSSQHPKHNDFWDQFQFDLATNAFRVVQVQKKDVKGLIVPGEPVDAQSDLALVPDAISIDGGAPKVVHISAQTKDTCTTLYALLSTQPAQDTISVRVFGRRPAHANCASSDPKVYTEDAVIGPDVTRSMSGESYTVQLFTRNPDGDNHCLQRVVENVAPPPTPTPTPAPTSVPSPAAGTARITDTAGSVNAVLRPAILPSPTAPPATSVPNGQPQPTSKGAADASTFVKCGKGAIPK